MESIATGVVGRAEELARITDFVSTGGGGPHALLLEGEPGMGKTTLWREAIRQAHERGDRVLTCTAGQSEVTVSYLALSELIGPALEEVIPAFPAAQARALMTALGHCDPGRHRPDRRAITVATVSAVRVLTAAAPVTLAVDDLQWVDVASARVLLHLFRNLRAEPVRLLATLRWPDGEASALELRRALPATCREMPVGPLDAVATDALVRARAGVDLPRGAMRRLSELAGGNPLYAIEIARAIDRGELESSPGEPLRVPASLRGLLRARLDALSPRARAALLLLAAGEGSPTECMRAAGASAAGLEEARRAGIIEHRAGRDIFTHPLLASTIYEDAASASRRRAHRRLAAAVDDPERHARHLGLAVARPDHDVAARLETAAIGARHRGAPAAAAVLFELAARATPSADPDAYANRTRQAAESRFDAGEPREARAMLVALLARSLPGPSRGAVLHMLAVLSWNDVDRIEPLLLEAAVEAAGDPRVQTLVESQLGWVALNRGDIARAARHTRRGFAFARDVDPADPIPHRLVVALQAHCDALLARRPRGSVTAGSPAVTNETKPAELARALHLTWTGELGAARMIFARERERYRELGAEMLAWRVLCSAAELELRAGEWRLAEQLVLEAEDVVGDAGLDLVRGEVLAVRARLAAYQGRLDEAAAAAREGLTISEQFGDELHAIRNQCVLGFVELSRGAAAEAAVHLDCACRRLAATGVEEPGAFPFAADAVEALLAAGETARAEAVADDLGGRARRHRRPAAVAASARCRAMITAALGDGGAAVRAAHAAVAAQRTLGEPFELARTLLISADILCRARRRREARAASCEAAGIFRALGAAVWAVRASDRMARLSGRGPSDDPLSPAERRIADLVARGHTNQQVAGDLVVSVKTVEAHLRSVYRKLDVASRTEMAHRLSHDKIREIIDAAGRGVS